MRCTRRQFLRTAGLGALAAGAGLRPRPAHAASRGARPPNLLFLWTDQQRPDTLGCYGNRRIRTPHLDALAAQSAVFEHACVTHPVCTPSRGSILTGLWPHQTGVTANNVPLPASARCQPALLPRVAAGDYATGYMGKWHLGDEVFAQHGFTEWVSIEDNYERHFSAGRDRATRSTYHEHLVAAGFKPDRPNNTFRRSTACRMPLPHTKPEFLADRAGDFLARHRDRPFLLHVNYLEPHTPFISPLRDDHPADQMPVPETFDRELGEDMPVRYRARQQYFRGEVPDAATLRDLHAHYWGLTEQVDRSVGRILRALEASGQAEHTVVVFTSDHGEMMGEHRMMYKGVMYEGALRVPLLVKAPGLRAQRIAAPVSHIDLVPTLLDLMGAPVDPALPGTSWRPLLTGGPAPRDHVFAEWSPNLNDRSDDPDVGELPGVSAEALARAKAESTRAVISPAGLKLCLRDSDRATLFDLARDPHETSNLIDHPAYREARAELTGRIQAWQAQTGDRLALA